MSKHAALSGPVWIPQTKVVLPIYLADPMKRCLCKHAAAICHIFVYFHRLNHVFLWSVSIITVSYDTSGTCDARKCSTQMKNKLKDIATPHFTISFFLTLFGSTLFTLVDFCCNRCSMNNIVLCARPPTNTAKKCKILAALMAPAPPDRD